MGRYDDMMKHPRYRLKTHRPMPEESRAAQFSAFAALTGYDEEIDETARLTTAREEMSEDDIAELDAAFQLILDMISEQPTVTIVFFQPDEHKVGGAYRIYTGQFRHYDAERKKLIFTDRTEITMKCVTTILFQGHNESRSCDHEGIIFEILPDY